MTVRFVLQIEAMRAHGHPCRLCSVVWACRSPDCDVDEETICVPEELPAAEHLDCPACTTGRFARCTKCGKEELQRVRSRPRWAKCGECGHMQVPIEEPGV